jgi:hypothetical protein
MPGGSHRQRGRIEPKGYTMRTAYIYWYDDRIKVGFRSSLEAWLADPLIPEFGQAVSKLQRRGPLDGAWGGGTTTEIDLDAFEDDTV